MKQQSLFIKKYIDDATSIMMKINPKWNEDVVKKTIKKMIEKKMMNPEVTIDNNYIGDTKKTTLLSVYDWALETKPLIAGNGTFYTSQEYGLNPIAQMLDEFLVERKRLKKEMFKIEDSESYDYKDLDRGQLNEKINVNSYYGASGAPSSAFYSLYSGPATTLTAQSVISTTEQLFESFITNSYLFIDINELMYWLETIISSINEDEIDDFICNHTYGEVAEILENKIINTTDDDYFIIQDYLKHVDYKIVNVIYYKNNLIGFIQDHKHIKELINLILTDIVNLEHVENIDNWIEYIPDEYKDDFRNKSYKDWNKFVDHKYFMDPNNVPSEISSYVKELDGYFKKYVYTPYLSFDRIYRLKNFKRDVVTVIDTDSNILSLDTFVNFIIDTFMDDNLYGRDFQKNIFIIINMITYSITTVVEDILNLYGIHSNIPKEYRPRFNMKNEFMFSKLIIGKAKKRYISKILLREGNMMNPVKIDVKGFDFKKATCSENSERIFMDIIKRHVIDSEHIDMRGILYDLKIFENRVRDSILNGERDYLPNGNAKELAAYKNPASVSTVRAFMAWNILNPDNQIELPSKISLLKMNIFNEDDIIDMRETYPEIYDRIIKYIFNDTTGIFVKREIYKMTYVSEKDKDWSKKIPKKYRTKYKKLGPREWNNFIDSLGPTVSTTIVEESKKGLQVLAIPSNATIPEWAIPYIDLTTMVNNILSPFRPVLELFGSQFAEEGKSHAGVNRKTEKFTNIIKF